MRIGGVLGFSVPQAVNRGIAHSKRRNKVRLPYAKEMTSFMVLAMSKKRRIALGARPQWPG